MSMNDLQVDMNNTILSATAGDTNTITSNNKVEIKIGILLHDDTRQGLSGVQIAVNEINQWDIIPGAFVTLIEKDVVDYQPIEQDQFSSLAISQAIYSVVSLIQQGVIGIIGDVSDSFTTLSALMTSTLEIPQCSYSATAASLADKSQYDYFFRTIPTDLLDVDVVISFILSQNWTTLGILYTTDAGLVTQNLISKTKKMGILSVKSSQTFEDDGNTNNIHASIDTLMSLGSRVVFIASKDSAAKALLIAAVTGHVNNETVWLIMGNASNVTHQLNQHVDLYNRIIQTRLNSGNQSSPTTYENAVEQLAWSTNKLNLLTMEHLFVGGVFIFEQQTELTGYPPYDTFRQKLSQFDPSATVATTYQSGLAYSCMMVMAHGFGQLVRDSVDSNCTLQELTSGQLKSRYSLALFNDTGFTTGPQGPVLFDKNGDIETGNFKIFNLHHGSQVTEIGHDLGGTFNLFRDPIYFDETKMPPSGTPTLTVIKAGITMPISIATASMAMIGIITTLMVLTLVIKFRHHPVFKLSSPIFCILELLGLLLSYISVPLFFISSYSIFTCFMLPITFYIGLSLILGTMISRNYRVYKTMNNVYNKGNNDNSQSGNIQLLKISCFILAFNTFILACWLVLFGNVKLSAIPVSTTVVVNTCSYDGPGHIIFVALLSFLAGIELCLSVYLALKTKSFGGYSKYSEHKQLGLSVYNIFFSALIGFIIFFMPTTDFYTRYYLTSMTILWASTFSLCVLFFPKIFKILSPKQAQAVSPNTEKRDDHPDDEKTLYDDQQLLTMNRMIATSCNILVDEGKRDSVLELSGSIHPTMETYQV
ncbi:hypothetical protein HMPREF1544_05997 [Mucor circinelloides 1006PhL]|uniref:G-protein coupled receptors family 3 profile domain-containing protein n=1 Tax=Mucor circinelloides f. circinelloides (strain 1006PhL) TaxID=1220926 RepID=S2JFB0_MUCC1|nr:hypothetical protein HMPREF1544_05997 [Mucor circinelloides 1006PhL]